MTKRDKLLSYIRDHPKTVRFADTYRIAEIIGFSRAGGKGSHTVYAKTGEPVILNFQNRDGYIIPYQARQLIEMMNKYEG